MVPRLNGLHVFTLILTLLLFGCNPAGRLETAALPTGTVPLTTIEGETAPAATPTATLTSTPTQPEPTATNEPLVCSPLAGFSLGELTGMVSNPYHPPAPGSDDPHHGVDLAVRLAGSQVAIKGNLVRAALAGTVVTTLHDRFPYGNAVIIETPLEAVPTTAVFPTPAPTLEPRSALTCPAAPAPEILDPGRRSLYVIYAHLDTLSGVEAGQTVTCGDPLGTVGDSGNTLAPHLHFEARVAPAGLQLASMAHYDPSATPDEMSQYCTWRISGLFQLVDPLTLLATVP